MTNKFVRNQKEHSLEMYSIKGQFSNLPSYLFFQDTHIRRIEPHAKSQRYIRTLKVFKIDFMKISNASSSIMIFFSFAFFAFSLANAQM